MKKLVWLSFVVLLLASACTTYTCPTYAQEDSIESNCEQSVDKV